MLTPDLTLILGAAATAGFVHTIFGPDHYLPFIVMARAGRWTLRRTLGITLLCGVGHVLSSVVLGLIGIGAGVALSRVEWIEATRGEMAAWALIAFGLLYMIWGIRSAVRNKPHTHRHAHLDVSEYAAEHQHEHGHSGDHTHVHAEEGAPRPSMTPWILFIVFVLGPCEVLIPFLMYPAAKLSVIGAVLVACLFSAVTIATMMGVVVVGYFGLSFVKMHKFERYVHAIAGGTIAASGLAIRFLGL